jgi:aspartate racemase
MSVNVMDIEGDPVIGIVGGMGPEAGLSLFNKILLHTEARTDQEHLSVMLMSFPKHIADRTMFLEGRVSVNPAYSVARIFEKLESAGSKVGAIACNTCHAPAIYNTILEELDRTHCAIKLVNMPFETCRYIKEHHANVYRIGVMCTNGTYKTGIYEHLLKECGYEVVVPDFGFQNDVIHRMIYDPEFGIKANPNSITREAKLLMDKALAFFKQRKASAIILGCTELSLVTATDEVATDMLVIDSTDALALALIREAKHERTGNLQK